MVGSTSDGGKECEALAVKSTLRSFCLLPSLLRLFLLELLFNGRLHIEATLLKFTKCSFQGKFLFKVPERLFNLVVEYFNFQLPLSPTFVVYFYLDKVLKGVL